MPCPEHPRAAWDTKLGCMGCWFANEGRKEHKKVCVPTVPAKVKTAKKCKNCGDEFVGFSRQIYCSVKCKNIAYQTKQNQLPTGARICEECHRPNTRSGQSMYCSNLCKRAAWSRAFLEKYDRAVENGTIQSLMASGF